METLFDTRTKLLYAISAWAMYISLLLLIIPELAWAMAGWEIDPFATGKLAVFVLVAGVVGRVVVQKKGSLRNFLFMVGTVGLAIFYASSAMAMSERVEHIEQHADAQTFDEIAIPLIAKWEGKELRAYFDVVGRPTIGYGHTRGISAADVRAGLTWTEEHALEMLRLEVYEYRDKAMATMAEATVLNHMPPPRMAAVTSLTYNIGWGGFGKSSARKAFDKGEIADGCRRMTWYNKAGGKLFRGLVNRRADENVLCKQGL